MQFNISYTKAKTIQAFRYHFISRKEIKFLMIMVNVFAITAAILFYTKKIRPEPFLLGSVIWVGMMLSIWYILPYTIYSKSKTFKDNFIATVSANALRLDNNNGNITWQWHQFQFYFETPHFFHVYFSAKSFFLIPKDDMSEEQKHEFRAVLNKNVGTK